MTDTQILNEIDKNNIQDVNENTFDDRQETSYDGLYLGCQIKDKKDNPNEHYGVISMCYSGVRKTGNDVGKPWFTVQEQFMSVERMNEITKDIPFLTRVVATYNCGNTPGGKQRLCKLTPIK